MKYIFFLVLPTLFISSCKQGDKTPVFNLKCYVRYDVASGQVTAEASMSEISSGKVVEIPDGIRYQSIPMKLLPAVGITYQHSYIARFVPEHRFNWLGTEGEKNEFVMSISPIDSFSMDGSSIANNQPARLSWKGDPLQKGETLVIMWENSAEGLTKPMEVTTTVGKPYIDFPAGKLSELSPGKWTLYLVRKKLTKSVVNGYQTSGIMEYYTRPAELTITGG
jgi:hypothetical protein